MSSVSQNSSPSRRDDLIVMLLHGGAASPEIAERVVDMFAVEVREESKQKADRAALLKLHEWDELLFGGIYCMHCTPDDADDPDQNVYWPCPPLRAAGVTDEEAVAHINAERAEIEARHRAEAEAGAR